MKIFIQHESYGCDTGCCGHVVQFDLAPGEKAPEGSGFGFQFSHPWGEDHRKWAEELIADEFGPQHVADLDWDQCAIVED